VVVLRNAGPLTTTWAAEHAPALLEAWWGGQEGGDAIADVLFGKVNPAGRLPYTVYVSADQVPPQDEYDVTKGFTYMYLNGKPLFPFGHGLSYTSFEYSNLKLSSDQVNSAGQVAISVDIKNTGARAGDEVAQLYVHAQKSRVRRPAKELRGFCRVTVNPGHTKTVTFELAAAQLAFYDVTVHGFVVDPGRYDLLIGSSSDEIRVKAEIEVNAGQK
jgi:beta-glucosidase